jgi:hypothetical protein
MSEPTPPGNRLVTLIHGCLERLTTMKLHVGVLRLRLRAGTVDAAAVEEHLDKIEAELDGAAALAHQARAEASGPS